MSRTVVKGALVKNKKLDLEVAKGGRDQCQLRFLGEGQASSSQIDSGGKHSGSPKVKSFWAEESGL